MTRTALLLSSVAFAWAVAPLPAAAQILGDPEPLSENGIFENRTSETTTIETGVAADPIRDPVDRGLSDDRPGSAVTDEPSGALPDVGEYDPQAYLQEPPYEPDDHYTNVPPDAPWTRPSARQTDPAAAGGPGDAQMGMGRKLGGPSGDVLAEPAGREIIDMDADE